jgi:hypothetical protein
MKNDEDAWVECMRSGDFVAAWGLSDRLLQRRVDQPDWRIPRHLQQIWDGKPLGGKRVLIRCYHGLGDSIQFARYAVPLRRIATEVTLWIQPELLPLAGTLRGVDRTIPLHDGDPRMGHADVPGFDFDADVEIMELPHALRLAPQTFTTVPYLHVASDRRDVARDSLAVGIVWKAGTWDLQRSIDPALLQELAAAPAVKLYNLCPDTAEEGSRFLNTIDISSANLLETAQRIAALDLVISVDTMLAHLAGAVGRPVWLLLKRNCDWRWQDTGSTNVWYPTMRHFRQLAEGEWKHPVEHVRTELEYAAAQPIDKRRVRAGAGAELLTGRG